MIGTPAACAISPHQRSQRLLVARRFPRGFPKVDGKVWQVWTASRQRARTAAQFSPQEVDALHGWISPTTILASDLQNAYWLSDDKPTQTVALKEIYGDPSR